MGAGEQPPAVGTPAEVPGTLGAGVGGPDGAGLPPGPPTPAPGDGDGVGVGVGVGPCGDVMIVTDGGDVGLAVAMGEQWNVTYTECG